MEGDLAKCDAFAFEEAMEASKNHILGLIEEVADAEGIYNRGEANFNNILASVAHEVKEYIKLKGEEQQKEYKMKCLDRIGWDHGCLDGACFVPMIVGKPDRPLHSVHEPTGGAVTCGLFKSCWRPCVLKPVPSRFT